MKEITVVNYQAEDGSIFVNKEDCLTYEDRVNNIARYKEVLGEIRDFCRKLGECSDCPFLIGDYCGITNTNVIESCDNIPANWDTEEWGRY